jgi:hypothetical protein
MSGTEWEFLNLSGDLVILGCCVLSGGGRIDGRVEEYCQ